MKTEEEIRSYLDHLILFKRSQLSSCNPMFTKVQAKIDILKWALENPEKKVVCRPHESIKFAIWKGLLSHIQSEKGENLND